MTIAIFVKVHLVQDVFRTVHYIVAIVFQVSATFKSDVKNLEIRVKRTDLDKVCGSGTCKLTVCNEIQKRKHRLEIKFYSNWQSM